jgi:hypothetical protein
MVLRLILARSHMDLNCVQVRRTRISERMRKLQDLVPNMDKVECFPFSISPSFVLALDNALFPPFAANKHIRHARFGC